MSISGPTLIAALLMGDPLNKPKTLEDITNDILQTFTTDYVPTKKLLTRSSLPFALISGPSGSFVMRESGSKTKTSRYYDNPFVRTHAELDSKPLTTNPSHDVTSSFTPGINSTPQSGTSFQSIVKHVLASSQMKELSPLTTSTSPLTQPLNVESNAGISASKIKGKAPSLMTANAEADELQIAITKSLETKETEDIKRATESSKLTKTEEDNIRIVIANSLEIKEAEDIQNAIEESSSIPAAPQMPANFRSAQVDPLTSLKAHLQNNKGSSLNKSPALPKSWDAELKQILARRHKSDSISSETNQREELTTEIRTAPKQTKVVTNKNLSEKALQMQALTAQSAKQQKPIDLISLIQTKKLSPTSQAPLMIQAHPVDVKDAVMSTLHSVLKTGAALLKSSPKIEVRSSKIKTLDELKADLSVAKASGADNFTLRALLVQIQELESTSQKINRDQTVRTAAASHQVRKVDLGDNSKAKSSKAQQALKNVEPSKDGEIRQRILSGNNRPEQLAALEERNAQALDAGTRSYEGPIVTLTKPAETVKDIASPPSSAPSSALAQAPTLPIVTETAKATSQAVIVKAPAVSQVKQNEASGDMFSALQSKIFAKEENSTTLTKEDVLKALTTHQNEIGLSAEDLKIIEAQPLENLKRVIDEFYNEEDQEWNFEYALDDPREIMSKVTVAKAKEEVKPKVKVGTLNIKKSGGTSFLDSIRAARGTIDNEETIPSQLILPSLTTTLLSQKEHSEPSVISQAPKPPSAPKSPNAKAQETLAKLSKKRQEAAAENATGTSLLEQILNKDQLVQLKKATPVTPSSEPILKKSETLEDVRNSALEKRRKSIAIDNDSAVDDEWDN
jgi:uncharacterized protein YqfB (UPF0267 family)